MVTSVGGFDDVEDQFEFAGPRAAGKHFERHPGSAKPPRPGRLHVEQALERAGL